MSTLSLSSAVAYAEKSTSKLTLSSVMEYALPFVHTGKELFSLLSQGFSVYDLIVTAASCAFIWLFFSVVERVVHTQKAKSWIVMFLSSIILSVFGCRAYYLTESQSLWDYNQVYGEDFISRCVVLFFVSSNVMDLVLGTLYYPSQLDPLTSIVHHIFYVTFMLVLLQQNYSRGFLLCFVMEVPTGLLALGSVWQQYRTDIGFGITFFITRLMYNSYLAYRLYCLSPEGLIWRVCLCVLCMHLFWFYKWATVYGSKLCATTMKI